MADAEGSQPNSDYTRSGTLSDRTIKGLQTQDAGRRDEAWRRFFETYEKKIQRNIVFERGGSQEAAANLAADFIGQFALELLRAKSRFVRRRGERFWSYINRALSNWLKHPEGLTSTGHENSRVVSALPRLSMLKGLIEELGGDTQETMELNDFLASDVLTDELRHLVADLLVPAQLEKEWVAECLVLPKDEQAALGEILGRSLPKVAPEELGKCEADWSGLFRPILADAQSRVALVKAAAERNSSAWHMLAEGARQVHESTGGGKFRLYFKPRSGRDAREIRLEAHGQVSNDELAALLLLFPNTKDQEKVTSIAQDSLKKGPMQSLEAMASDNDGEQGEIEVEDRSQELDAELLRAAVREHCMAWIRTLTYLPKQDYLTISVEANYSREEADMLFADLDEDARDGWYEELIERVKTFINRWRSQS